MSCLVKKRYFFVYKKVFGCLVEEESLNLFCTRQEESSVVCFVVACFISYEGKLVLFGNEERPFLSNS